MLIKNYSKLAFGPLGFTLVKNMRTIFIFRNKVGELLKYITSPKLLIQFAKAKEHDGKYKDAAIAYKKAKDYENVIRYTKTHEKGQFANKKAKNYKNKGLIGLRLLFMLPILHDAL